MSFITVTNAAIVEYNGMDDASKAALKEPGVVTDERKNPDWLG